MMRRVRIGAVACAAGLLLAGCEGGSERRELADASPLAEFLEILPRSQLGLPHLDEQERLRQDAHAELIARCMADAGFEYQAVTIAERLGESFLAAYETDPGEFAQRYGYGVTTIEVEQYTDPNEQLRAELAAADQAEYDRALWGDGSVGSSCHQQAVAEVYGDPGDRAAGFAEFESLLEQIDELYREIDTDPRLREAHQRWAACMAAAGYAGFAAPRDARASVFDRLPAGRQGAAPLPGSAPAGEVDEQRLAEVREYELALAPVDRDCQRRLVDGPRRLVTMELERAFVEAHRDELARYRDWLAG